MTRKAPDVANPCRLGSGELIAYQDGTLSAGRREIVEAHLTACRYCQDRLAAFDEVDRIIRDRAIAVKLPQQRRAALRTRLLQEAHNQARLSNRLKPMLPPQSLAVKFLVALLVLLAALPPATQAGFPLGRFVHFAEVEIREALPLDAQKPIRHVAPTDPSITEPSFDAIAPAELPLGLARVEQSAPNPDRVELLFRNQAGVALLVTQLPADQGMVTLEPTGTEVTQVQGTDVLIVRDPRPDAVAALTWEHDGVFFDVMVIEAPPGAHGGFKQTEALQVVGALMDGQNTSEE